MLVRRLLSDSLSVLWIRICCLMGAMKTETIESKCTLNICATRN